MNENGWPGRRRDISRHLAFVVAACLALLCGPAGRAGGKAKPGKKQPTVMQRLLKNAFTEVEPLRRQALKQELQTYFYADLQRLEPLAREDRDEAEEQLDQLLEEADAMLDAREDDPARYERMVQLRKAHNVTLDLAAAAQRAPAGKREALEGKLRQALARYFDLRQQAIGREINDLERELKRLKRSYARRQEKRKQMIERRLRELLEPEEDEIEW